MRYRIREHLSFCLVHGHAIFLDVEADRYFRLPSAVERIFLEWNDGRCDLGDAALASLLELRLVVPTESSEEVIPVPCQVPPVRSALELHSGRSLGVRWLLPEILLGALASRRSLHTCGLRELLQSTSRYRSARLADLNPGALTDSDSLIELAQQFNRARLMVPIEPCCLPDSLALIRFLARRRILSHIVFGVTAEPFSAHCWVQVGDMVLNDTVGNALAHTPVKVL